MIFIPYHFIGDIAKKAVFMRRDKIEKWFLTSAIMSTAITAAELVYGVMAKQLYLFDGVLPLVVPAASSLILFLLYGIFKSSAFKLYDDLQDFVAVDSVVSEVMQESEQSELTEDDSYDDVVLAAVSGDIAEQTAEQAVEPVTESVTRVSDADIRPKKLEPMANVDLSDITLDLDECDIETQVNAAMQEAKAVTGASDDFMTKATQNAKLGENAPSAADAGYKSTTHREARKAMFKNKMLTALYGKLENVKSERNLPDTELERVCSEQEFITADDLITDYPVTDIDTILFGESDTL